MKQWVPLRDVEEIPKGVVSARTGSNVIFAAYSRGLDQWYHVYPGGESKIPSPQMLFVERDEPLEPWRVYNPDQLELPLEQEKPKTQKGK